MADSPEILPWDEIARLLRAISLACPRPGDILHNHHNARAVLRIRDIADYCRIESRSMYYIINGKREYNESVQKKLSWFFNSWHKGFLTKKEQADGKWRIVYGPPKQKAHADEASASPKGSKGLVIDWMKGTLRLV